MASRLVRVNPVTVNDVLDGHVKLDIESLDRVYLHGYLGQLRGGVNQDPAMADQFGAQPLQGVDHPAVHLDNTALQFGDVNVGQLGQQFGPASRQPLVLRSTR